MNIKHIKGNHRLLTTNHGDEILYSDVTPVAGFSPKIGYFRNSEETSDQVARYLLNIERVTDLLPIEIELMFLGE